MCMTSAEFDFPHLQILEKLVENHLHRLYIVDDAVKPVGVVTLTDILRVVTNQSH